MPELARAVKILTQWAPSHTAVRSRARVRQPDQSSVSLLSWCSALLWVTEASAASQIPNDGGCSRDATTWLILCRVRYVLFLFFPLRSSSQVPRSPRHNLTSTLWISRVAAPATKKIWWAQRRSCVFPHPLLGGTRWSFLFFPCPLPFVCCPLPSIPPASIVFCLFPVAGECKQAGGLKQC